MRSIKIMGLACCLSLAFAGVAAAKGTSSKKASSRHAAAKASSKKASGKNSSGKKTSGKKSQGKTKKAAWKRRGQQSIDSDRTMQIQEALINAGYLKGDPSGRMDLATKQALIKLQGENGWQTKVVPDSRALIKLGLGPDHSNLLNPDTAMLPAGSNTALGGNPQ
jgi:peptidoglycan hydrolase-like protein with peptidoglycan-binding domain